MKLLGNETPESLLRTLHRNNMTYFGLRANTEHRNMCWGDVVTGLDGSCGLQFLEYKTERATKTRTGLNPRNKRQVKIETDIFMLNVQPNVQIQ
jgi:hypothetical protein